LSSFKSFPPDTRTSLIEVDTVEYFIVILQHQQTLVLSTLTSVSSQKVFDVIIINIELCEKFQIPLQHKLWKLRVDKSSRDYRGLKAKPQETSSFVYETFIKLVNISIHSRRKTFSFSERGRSKISSTLICNMS
jgi:hypothetical protein